MASSGKVSSEAGENSLLVALLSTQEAYSAVLAPVIVAVRQMREAAETLPATRQSAGLDLLREFGAAVVANARAGDLQGIRAACDDYVNRFHRLAGN